MDTPIDISSLSNEKVKKALSLKERRARKQTDQFLIEGYRELVRSLEKPVSIETLFVCEKFFLKNNEPRLIQKIALQNAQVLYCSEKVFQKLSYRDRPDGLLAVANQFHEGKDQLNHLLATKKNGFYLVCESIEKPGNLGTILRSCDATAVDGVIVCDACTDLFNPNVVRASVGTLFTQPIFELSSNEAIALFKKHKVLVASSSPDAKRLYTDADFTKSVALIVGTEQYGISEEWKKHADIMVRIPMRGSADSLNVGSATTILLYEVLRQRS